MFLVDFASERGVKPDTVATYIRRRKPQFEGHVVKGHKMELDEYAVQLLDEVYPLPKPVYIIQGVDPDEHKAVLAEKQDAERAARKALEALAEAERRIASLDRELVEAKQSQLLLSASLESAESAKKELSDKTDSLEKDVQAARDELSSFRHIFGRLYRK